MEFPSATNKPAEIFITDVTGRMVYNRIVPGAEKKFNIATAALKQGIYYCTVKSGDLENRKPVIIIHE